MGILTLNRGSANEITVGCQHASRTQPVFIGDVSPSFSGIERNAIRGHRRTHSVVLTFIDTQTELWVRQIVANDAQVTCSGDLFGTGLWLCSITIGESRMVPGTSPILWEASATIREVLPNYALFKYVPGDSIPGYSFTRALAKNQFDANGVLQTAAVNALADANYIGGVRTTLFEAAARNDVLWNRDLTNALWVKTSCTAALNQVGIDGVSNSASLLTATGANATCLQSITAASQLRSQSAYVKRITGSGPIQMTMDGGATWGTITVSSGVYGRNSIPTQTLTNPQVGFRIVTSGDAIAVDFVHNEFTSSGAAYISSPIATTSAIVTRPSDLGTMPFNALPQPLTMYAKFVELADPTQVGQRRIIRIGSSDVTGLLLYSTGGNTNYTFRHANGVSAVGGNTQAITWATGDTIELRGVLLPTGAVYMGSTKNGAAELVGATSIALALASAWGSLSSEFPTTSIATECLALIALKILRGERTLAECRAQ